MGHLPTNTNARKLAKHHNNGSKKQRFSFDNAKSKWYSYYRTQRFNRHMSLAGG